MKDSLYFEDGVYKSMYPEIPVFDCHIHVMDGADGIDKLIEFKDEFNFQRMNILSVTGMGDISQNIKCILFKNSYKEMGYAFGGLIHDERFIEGGNDYLEQTKRLISLGFDGMKMIEGKPGIRRGLNKPLNHPSYDGFYDYLEKNEIPLLYHVADPTSFWDINEIPKWALDSGWFYGDGRYVKKDELHSEIDGVLEKFPKLKAIFAHFYFLSDDIERISAFLDKWVNVSIDITPGTEMYVNFSKHPKEWREFFIKYQDRIMFGTDIYDYGNDEERTNIINSVNIARMFLETDCEFKVWDLNLKGIGLDKDVLEKIYHKNADKYIGSKPKELNIDLAIEEAKLILNFAKNNGVEKEKINEIEKIMNILISKEDF